MTELADTVEITTEYEMTESEAVKHNESAAEPTNPVKAHEEEQPMKRQQDAMSTLKQKMKKTSNNDEEKECKRKYRKEDDYHK